MLSASNQVMKPAPARATAMALSDPLSGKRIKDHGKPSTRLGAHSRPSPESLASMRYPSWAAETMTAAHAAKKASQRAAQIQGATARHCRSSRLPRSLLATPT